MGLSSNQATNEQRSVDTPPRYVLCIPFFGIELLAMHAAIHERALHLLILPYLHG